MTDDPRAPGEPLWPDRFGGAYWRRQYDALGPALFAALCQQDPGQRWGGLTVPEDPRNEARIKAVVERLAAQTGRAALPTPPPEARTSFRAFVAYVRLGFEWNWHHDVMIRHIQDWVDGVCTRLMIFAPRRHSKSEIVSRLLPAFLFGQNPDEQLMCSSHTVNLARSMSRSVQRVIVSPRYQALFPATRLPGGGVQRQEGVRGMRTMLEWELDGREGAYRGMGVGTGAVGFGYTRAVIDDVFKSREDAMSVTIREKVWDWYSGDIATGQQPGARILITNTRYHTEDLPGRLLKLAREDPKADQWRVLSLPAVRGAA